MILILGRDFLQPGTFRWHKTVLGRACNDRRFLALPKLAFFSLLGYLTFSNSEIAILLRENSCTIKVGDYLGLFPKMGGGVPNGQSLCYPKNSA